LAPGADLNHRKRPSSEGRFLFNAHLFQMLPTSRARLTAHNHIPDNKEIAMRALPFVLSFAITLAGCSAPPQSEFNPLLSAIGQRLDLAYAVAVHKWDNGVPVEAPMREQEVLQQAQATAHDYGLPPERAAAFFSDQIEANKMIQYGLIDRWTALGKRPPQQARDLADELRPRLDMLQATLLFELGNLDRKPMNDCPRQLTEALNRHAGDPLRHMALVRATAQLCVGR